MNNQNQIKNSTSGIYKVDKIVTEYEKIKVKLNKYKLQFYFLILSLILKI